MIDSTHSIIHWIHFDGLLHWCFLIAIGVVCVGLIWVFTRVLMPLRKLSRLALSWNEQAVPSFAEAVGGIAELERLRSALQSMSEQIHAAHERSVGFRQAMAESQEQERVRIAREIHDDTIQSLIVTMHHLDRISHLVKADDAALTTLLRAARAQLVETTDGLRRIIADLRPPLLNEMGLMSALETLCEAHPKVVFSVKGQVFPLQSMQQLAIYRTLQEAIRNAERHADAAQIHVEMIYSCDHMSIEIRDDGSGFTVPAYLHEFAATGHYGLLGIRERVEHLGGKLHVSSAVKQGTRLIVTFPALAATA